MNEMSIEDAVLDAGVLLRADGADLRLVSFDQERGELHVAVDLDGAECAECVIPPELLSTVITDAITRAYGATVNIVVDDPRT